MIAYKKVGGLHFVRLGRLGFSFYIAKKTPPRAVQDRIISEAEYQRACRRSELYAKIRGDIDHYNPQYPSLAAIKKDWNEREQYGRQGRI